MATSITLNRTGQKMPLVGLGTWKIPQNICADAVYTAIKLGYRLLDGAADYGNEKEVGEGVRRALADGLIKREELFITSKLWNTFHARDHVKPIAKKQLEDWGIDYFDLYLIHFPVSLEYVDPAHRYPPAWHDDSGNVVLEDTPIQETWRAMEELVDDGLAKNIGVSNFSGSILLDLSRYARIKPQVLQIELHPYLTQERLLAQAHALGIAVNAYSSFGPQGYVELGMDRGAPSLLAHDVVAQIGRAKGATPAQVLLRWSTQRGIVVIPKSTERWMLVENLHCGDFSLTEEEILKIGALNLGLRMNDPADIDTRLAIFA